jgi:cytochrome c peroxidase
MRYKKSKNITLALILLLSISGCQEESDTITIDKVSFGETLFNEKSFSLNRTMSCATCHDSQHAFIDARDTLLIGASLGDDNSSIGDRNAPTVAYATFSPEFHYDETEELYIGGQFLDGRAKDLKDQAEGPFLNPIEMNMPDAASVVIRLKQNSDYVTHIKALYGDEILDDNQKAFEAMADAISAYEQSSSVSTFDSKFDKFLKGDYNLSASEQRGFDIFINEEDTAGAGRCILCHTLSTDTNETSLFTDYSYDNLGVPVNHALRDSNGQNTLDVGLFGNSEVNDTTLKGSFKVSSLRNIAQTGPYMHNGVFKDLATVVHFYNTRDVAGAINPETNATWEAGEFDAFKNSDELGNLGLSSSDESDLVNFLKLLSDERFEQQ